MVGGSILGLSPRVRGSQFPVIPRVKDSGSIPACAGEPGKPVPNSLKNRVYPRVCGGAEISRFMSFQAEGLSPRVRGSHDVTALGTDQRGSIPACAGEPHWIVAAPRDPRVYPRVCGGASPRRP